MIVFIHFYLVLDLGISTKRKLEFSLAASLKKKVYFFVCLILTQVMKMCLCV